MLLLEDEEEEEEPLSKTSRVTLTPLGAVTTQKAAPPTPMVEDPSISLTSFLAGSMAQGRPLQCPSHVKRMPKSGFLSLKGVAGSR